MKTKIYFICPNNKRITGGVKQIYRQVEILKKNGFSAYILHNRKDNNKWFYSTNVPIRYSPYIFKLLKFLFQNKKINILSKFKLFLLRLVSERIDSNSILVFPEIYGNRIIEIEPKVSKVIFNQGCYLTFNGFYDSYKLHPYNHEKTLATIVASEDALNYLNFSFPSIKNLFKMKLGINHSIFNYSQEKKKQICFMPRKLNEDATQIINILKQRNILKEWNIVAIDNKKEREVANIMNQSILYLNLCRCEGFGLPAAEAMASGCYVIGYHGQGGKEYFKPEFSTVVSDGDIIEFVKKIEEFIDVYEKYPQKILQKTRKASDFILSNYSLENEETDTVKIWTQILDRHKEKRV